MKLKNSKVGLAVTGSFCNFSSLEEIVLSLKKEKVGKIIPIVTPSILNETNRFSTPENIILKLETLTNTNVIDTISKAEPIGPKNLIDVLIIAPCTGNTLAKIAHGITDTTVLMAMKSHIRNNKPVVIGISTNDGLGSSLENIGKVLNTKNIYFVPFRQDNYIDKPKSLVFDHRLLIDTLNEALCGKQIQPLLLNN